MRLPDRYTEYMKRLLKKDFSLYEKSLLKSRFFGLRVNTSKISVSDFLEIVPFKLDPVPWTDDGFYYDENERPALHPYYHAGLFYLQEPSAMAPASVLKVNEGDTVLDLCAAPGGKSTKLGQNIFKKGLLVSNDVSASRAAALLKNIELFGFSEVTVISEEAYRINELADIRPDKILIDAPCSGEGMFRKDPKLISAWEQNGPDHFSKIQKEITGFMAQLLKPGGYMLYSTCTFNRYENEEVIIHLLENNPELELEDIPKVHGFRPGITESDEEKKWHLERCARLFPFALDGEGHFLALIKKKGCLQNEILTVSSDNRSKSGNENRISPETKHFLSLIKKEISYERLRVSNGKVYYLPGRAFFPGSGNNSIRYIRNGLFLGEEKKNRFEPSQALAMHLKKNEYPYSISLPASDMRVEKYLRGEGIVFSGEDEGVSDDLPEKCTVLFSVDGFPLGWGRLSGMNMKNRYLPGWRRT